MSGTVLCAGAQPFGKYITRQLQHGALGVVMEGHIGLSGGLHEGFLEEEPSNLSNSQEKMRRQKELQGGD